MNEIRSTSLANKNVDCLQKFSSNGQIWPANKSAITRFNWASNLSWSSCFFCLRDPIKKEGKPYQPGLFLLSSALFKKFLISVFKTIEDSWNFFWIYGIFDHSFENLEHWTSSLYIIIGCNNSFCFTGYKLEVHVDSTDKNKPLQLSHFPQVQGSESIKVPQAIKVTAHVSFILSCLAVQWRLLCLYVRNGCLPHYCFAGHKVYNNKSIGHFSLITFPRFLFFLPSVTMTLVFEQLHQCGSC